MSKPLLKDLEELVHANIISAATAEQIKLYYQNRKEPANGNFNIVLGILGALLVGFGIVLLVAHNWDEMSRSIQTLFAFLPMACGQALCLYTLVKRKENIAWRESSSVILFFAVASCMALVSQIFHITGTLDGFILTWLCLTAPLIYIMRSSLVSLLVIACATWYAILIGYNGIFTSRSLSLPYFYLVFLAFVIPHYYYQYVKSNRKSNFFHLHNWFFVMSSIVALGAFAGKTEDHFQWIFVAYCVLFGLFYLVGRNQFFRDQRLYANPFLIAGVVGPVVIFLIWSYQGVWADLPGTIGNYMTEVFNSLFFYVTCGLLIVHIVLLTQRKQTQKPAFDPLAITPYVFALTILFLAKAPAIGLLVINAWLLVLGIHYVRKGSARDHLGILNLGLLIIAFLAILRFFDDSIGFVWRGLFFVATGVGFFLANYLLLKKRKSIS